MDNDLYALFDVPAPVGGQEGPSDAPQGEAGTQGTTDDAPGAQEDAAPQDGETAAEQPTKAPDKTDAEDAEGATETDPAAPPEQTKAERAQHAAARRRAETQAAIEEATQKAVADERVRVDGVIASLGIPNPYSDSGETIRTLEELEAYQKEHAKKSLQRRMASGKATPEDIRAIVSEMPQVKAAAEAVEKANAAAEAAQKSAFEAQVEKEMQAIHALDPAVNTLEDILAMDNAEEFAAAVKEHRMTYLEAYKFVNMDKLTAAAAQNARREESQRQRGKEHLQPVTSRGAGAVTVPADEMALYRQLMPDASEAEIQQHYNRYVKHE